MKYFISIFFSMLLLASSYSHAQTDAEKQLPNLKVGIFAPLFLDSVFNNNILKYKQGIPRFIMPALDFIQGAQIALDSLPSGGVNMQATIYDSKAYTENISWLIQNKKLDSLDLLIGNVKDADYKLLADFALLKKIPFVSATYPNDGGITANPYLIIINSTLKAHCDAIYSYLFQNHGTDKIFICRQKGSQEDMVTAFLKQANEREGKALLDMKVLNFDEKINTDYFSSQLDSNRKNILIGCSLDEIFVENISAACFKLQPTYPITLIGMPNWDGMAVLHKKDAFKNFPVYFTSPYYNNKWNSNSKIVTNAYLKKYKTRPSDMAFKGFETVAYFTQLLKKHPGNLMNNLNDKSISSICDYNFKPVLLKKESLTTDTPDYYENKHLYFIKLVNGSISLAW